MQVRGYSKNKLDGFLPEAIAAATRGVFGK
jgi:hypothetical protein